MTAPSFVIGIAGGTGAGKTAVAREVGETVGEAVSILPLDNYYQDHSHLPAEERDQVNYDHPSAFEWELLAEQIKTLLDGRPIEMPQYDFTVHNRTDERVRIEPTEILIVEGILSLFEERLRDLYDLCIYVQTDADVRILRRIRRDVIERDRTLESVMNQYLTTVKPMHERYVEPTREHADVIIPEGLNYSAVDLITKTIHTEMREQEPPISDAS
ncbi:uridine kinase [Halocatena pleomorpha]|uniref:Uridine kinase n=1 Tax=Halocatena pleomorpha TaxID=1785090 RepID=A0A3P3RIV2_9EURY|nr:uridine kinase [Halocatena pleomorpha]RRJ33421.1 uridine kinase [Halocatena pleomorpha]